jgi:hypothetical protein
MNRANYHVEKADPGFPVLEKNSVIAGAPKFVNFAVLEENLRILSGYSVVLSPGIRNLEWDLRVALNAFLSGMSAAEFLAEQEAFFNSTHWGPWVRNPELKKQRLIEREAAFASIAAAPLEAIAMFKVRYVFLAPDATLQNLSPLWSQKLYSGTHFQVLQLKL